MKKITSLFLVFLFFTAIVNAKLRTPDEARQVASAFLQKNPAMLMKAPAANNQLNLIYESFPDRNLSGNQNQPLYYIYNRGENSGFVIVSADDRANAILGYADSGSFDFENIPENFRHWLGFYEKELTMLSLKPEEKATVANFPSVINPETVNVQKTAAQANAGVAPLLGGIKWNQNSPYNDLCPLLPPANTTRAATGCAATAMAQVLKYHEWPVTGTGSNSYTTHTLGISMSVDFSATTYDWANMTDTYTTSSLQIQKDAVATLMLHCGVAADMDYNTESATNTLKVANALKSNFGFDENLQRFMRDFYTRSEWIAILKEEIDNSRPVLYSGFTTAGAGHMFVCDGYDNEDYFHFNWGWGGMSNGFFAITALNPGDIGIGGGDGTGYNSNQHILTGIQKPNASSVPSYVLAIDSLLTHPVAAVARNDQFSIGIHQFWNFGMNTFDGMIGLALYNTSGLVQVLSQGAITLNSYTGWSSLNIDNINIPGSIPDGVYKLHVIYKANTESDWQIARGRVGTPNFVKTTLSSSEIQFETDNSVYPQLTQNSISVTGNLYQNKTGRFNVNITNSGGEYNSNVIVYLQSTADDDIYQNVTSQPLNIATGETVDKHYYGEITVDPGEYYYLVYTDPDNNPSTNSYTLLGWMVVNVLAEPTGEFALTMPDVMSFPDNNNVPKNNAILTSQISNSGAYFENRMIAFIFPEGGGSSLGYIGHQNVIIDAGETATVNFTGTIDLPNGTYWIAAYFWNGSTWVSISPTEKSVIQFTLGNAVWTGNSNHYEGKLTVYPNPATEKVFVKSDIILDAINIFDLSGRRIFNLLPRKNGEIEVSVSGFEKGIYILQTIDAENRINNMKFVKK